MNPFLERPEVRYEILAPRVFWNEQALQEQVSTGTLLGGTIAVPFLYPGSMGTVGRPLHKSDTVQVVLNLSIPTYIRLVLPVGTTWPAMSTEQNIIYTAWSKSLFN